MIPYRPRAFPEILVALSGLTSRLEAEDLYYYNGFLKQMTRAFSYINTNSCPLILLVTRPIFGSDLKKDILVEPYLTLLKLIIQCCSINNCYIVSSHTQWKI
jgi:hypothetical protein